MTTAIAFYVHMTYRVSMLNAICICLHSQLISYIHGDVLIPDIYMHTYAQSFRVTLLKMLIFEHIHVICMNTATFWMNICEELLQGKSSAFLSKNIS